MKTETKEERLWWAKRSQETADNLNKLINEINQIPPYPIEAFNLQFLKIISKQMKTEKEFAVKSDSRGLCVLFAEEYQKTTGKYLQIYQEVGGKRWMAYVGECRPEINNVKEFNLGSQFSEALAYTKKIMEESKEKKLTYEEVAKELFSNHTTYFTSVNGEIEGLRSSMNCVDPNNATTSHHLSPTRKTSCAQ